MPQQLRVARRRLTEPFLAAPIAAEDSWPGVPGLVAMGEEVDYLLLDGGPLAPRGASAAEDQADLALAALAPRFYLDPRLRVVASLGGGDARQTVTRVAAGLSTAGSPHTLIGLVRGDQLLGQLETLMQAGAGLAHRDTGEPFSRLTKPIVAASAVFDRRPLAAALLQDARVVLIGHSDPLAMLGAAAATSLPWPEPEKLGQALGAAAPLLGGDGELIEIANDGTARAISPESLGLEGVSFSEGRPRETGLEILYRSGFTAACLLESLDKSTLEKRRADWESAAGVAIDFESRAYQDQAGRGRSIAHVRFVEQNAPQACESLSRVLQAARRAGCLPVADFPPRVFPKHEVWPTSVPNDIIEWSVEVRSAREWLDC